MSPLSWQEKDEWTLRKVELKCWKLPNLQRLWNRKSSHTVETFSIYVNGATHWTKTIEKGIGKDEQFASGIGGSGT
eukprot:scaffold2047_cov129-Cylindrotheca_fusiformis.AAC.2